MSAHPVQIAPAPADGAPQPACENCSRSLAPRAKPASNEYTCPMDPEVRQQGPGDCPKCGMALEPVVAALPATKTEYTCPMHPEIVRDAPGSCPICGMALEPRTVSVEEEKNPELVEHDPKILDLGGADDSDSGCGHGGYGAWTFGADAVRFAKSLAMVGIHPRDSGGFVGRLAVLRARLAIARHAQLEYVHADRSGNRGGVRDSASWGCCFPEYFPASFRGEGGEVAVYFEAAAAITTLVLLGQVMELRARSRTGAAIKALLGLAPKTARLIRDDGSEVGCAAR